MSNTRSILVILAIYVFATFQIEKALMYDVFNSPDHTFILKTIVSVIALGVFAYFITDIYANEKDIRNTYWNVVGLSVIGWILIKIPQMMWYGSSAYGGKAGINGYVVLEWLLILIVPLAIVQIYKRRTGFRN